MPYMPYSLASEVRVHSVMLDESCDVPACVNPNHLFLGTQSVIELEAIEGGLTFGPLLLVTREAAWDMAQAILRELDQRPSGGMTHTVSDQRKGERRVANTLMAGDRRFLTGRRDYDRSSCCIDVQDAAAEARRASAVRDD